MFSFAQRKWHLFSLLCLFFERTTNKKEESRINKQLKRSKLFRSGDPRTGAGAWPAARQMINVWNFFLLFFFMACGASLCAKFHRTAPQNADTYKLKQNQKLRRPEEEAFPSHSTRTNSKCVCVFVCVFRLCGLSALVRQLGKTVDCRGVVGGLHSTNYANAYLEWYSFLTDKQKWILNKIHQSTI